MYKIRENATGWYLCGYNLWTPDADSAMEFSSEEGVHCIAVVLTALGFHQVEVVQ